MKANLTRQCPACDTYHTLAVDLDSYVAWKAGSHIQDAFPGQPADWRELLKTGICPACWDTITEGPDDE
jgi:hypothetical protein